MPRRPKEFARLLETKFGFSESQNRSVDHRWFELQLPGLPTITTKFSHGNKDINKSLEAKIARQIRVRATFLRGMLDCTNSREAYYQQLQDDPFPPFDVTYQ